MNFDYNGIQYQFSEIRLSYAEETFENVFKRKNNKTLSETISHRRYLPLAAETNKKYAKEITMPIGDFLFNLKQRGDNFYARFLNRYGDLTFSRFWIEDEETQKARGLYLYADNGRILYIGRCRDSFRKRINQGYGSIQPKNCFVDGQATNCHINSLITECDRAIQFQVCPIQDMSTIINAEALLIQRYNPDWNIQLKSRNG